jgi:4-amino-4-deoxy-L-arabinose transferase-like glycosyltransferase
MTDNWNNKKTIALFIIILGFRALFSWYVPLIDDEAYHWSWTQNLMLSYYDHPGMIAWLETLSLNVFGTTYWGIRFPSFVCFGLTVIVSFRLAKELFGEVAALVTGFMLFWSPLWGFGGYVASPETPFMLCFVLATWIFWQGVKPAPAQRWPLAKTWAWLGLVMGLGLNSKFIIALLAPGFGLYLLLTPDLRKTLIGPWPWLGALLATIVSTPIFLWNFQYDWPGFRYQFYERHTGAELSWNRWFEWFAAQNIFFTPIVFLLIVWAFFHGFRATFFRASFFRSGVTTPDSPANSVLESEVAPWRFIFCLTAPTILVFYPQPLWAEFKPHWAGGSHLLLVMGAGALWKTGFAFKNQVWLQPMSKKILLAVLAFIIPLNFFIYTPFLGPWLPKVYRGLKLVAPSSAGLPESWNIRWDLSNEFYGWEDLGKEVLRTSREFHAEVGQKPFIAALRYETTAQTWWGTRQKVYSLSHTKSNYTVLQKAHQELEALVAQNALVVTPEKYPANPMEWAHFDRCEPREFRTYRKEELARIFTIWKCYNYQGLK